MHAYLRRYTDYYQGLAEPPNRREPGSARKWFYFRIIHAKRIQWENEQHKKREEESKRSSGEGQQVQSSKPSRRRDASKRRVDPERAEEEGREMTQAEKVVAAQKKFGIDPHKPEETLGSKTPKGFKRTRLKRRR
jgi:hypothetical protein